MNTIQFYYILYKLLILENPLELSLLANLGSPLLSNQKYELYKYQKIKDHMIQPQALMPIHPQSVPSHTVVSIFTVLCLNLHQTHHYIELVASTVMYSQFLFCNCKFKRCESLRCIK